MRNLQRIKNAGRRRMILCLLASSKREIGAFRVDFVLFFSKYPEEASRYPQDEMRSE